MAKRLLNEGGAYRVTGLFSFTDEWIKEHIAYVEDTIEAWEYEKKRRNIDNWAKVIADYLSDDENMGTLHYMLDNRNALFAGWTSDGEDVWLPAIGVKDSWCDDMMTDYDWIDAPIVNEYGDVMEDMTFNSSADVTYDEVKRDIEWILEEYDEMMSDVKDKVNQINLENWGSDEEEDEEMEECKQPKLNLETIKRKEKRKGTKLMKEGYGENNIDADSIAEDIFERLKPDNNYEEIDADLDSEIYDELDGYFIYDSDIEDMCREYANDEYEDALSRALEETKDVAWENAYSQIMNALEELVDDWNDNVEEEPEEEDEEEEEEEEEEVEEESRKLKLKEESRFYELTPNNGRQSFYGKAIVEVEDNGDEILYSYNTPIMKRTSDGKLIRFYDGWSMTTGNHIRAFSGLNKHQFLNLPLDQEDASYINGSERESRFYDLEPNNGRQSFYGKARVKREPNGDEVLYSYNTPIIKKTKDGDLIRLYDDWSATTGRHIAAFCGLNKRQFFDVPYEGEDY